MQSCLTVESAHAPIRKVAEHGGVRVPWDVRGYREDAELAERRGGFFDATHWGDVAVTGPDARGYLNRMSTVNFKTFEPEHAAYGSFLTGRAGVVTLGMFLEAGENEFHYLTAPGQSAAVASYIEKFHFLEALTVTDDSERWALFALWSPRQEVCAALGIDPEAEPMRLVRIRAEYGEALAWRDQARPALHWVRMPRTAGPAFLQWLRIHDVPLLGYHLFEYHRLKSGMPEVGAEVTDKDLILEANLELAISRNKGCYPGQEVVERIFTYGQVNRKLLPVTIAVENQFPQPPFVVTSDGKKAGMVVALLPDPRSAREAVGLAYIQRQFWASTEGFVSEDGQSRVRLR